MDFVRRINLPALLYGCLKSYEKNQPTYQFTQDLEIVYESSQEKVTKGVLCPEFSSVLWEDIFNGCFGESLDNENQDCIFITLKRNSQGKLDGKFQKYWFASLLHAIHPRIYYLNFKTLNEETPSPLFRVKLMEGKGRLGRKTLVVGGVLGEDFRKIKTRGIEEYIDECLIEFFESRYPHKKYSFSKRTSLFYNFNHCPGENRPYNQFIEYIKRKYSISSSLIKTIFSFDKKASSLRLSVESDKKIRALLANQAKENKKEYDHEQYSETFEKNKKVETPGAFTCLEGVVNGFNLSKREIDWERKALAKRYIKTSIIARRAIGAYLIAVTALSIYNLSKTNKQPIASAGRLSLQKCVGGQVKSDQKPLTKIRSILKQVYRQEPEIKPFCYQRMIHYDIVVGKRLCSTFELGESEEPGLQNEFCESALMGLKEVKEVKEAFKGKPKKLEEELKKQCRRNMKLRHQSCANLPPRHHLNEKMLEKITESLIGKAGLPGDLHYTTEPIFEVNTTSLQEIEAKNIKGGLLYIKNKNPWEIYYHPFPFEAAKRLEELLKPFIKNN